MSLTSVSSHASTGTTDSTKNDSGRTPSSQKGNATTEFARIVSVPQTSGPPQPSCAIGFHKTAAERSTKRVIKRRRVSMEEPPQKMQDTDYLMPVIPRKPKKVQSPSLVVEKSERTNSMDEWITYAASLPAVESSPNHYGKHSSCIKTESPTNHNGGITMEAIEDEEDDVPYAATRSPSSNACFVWRLVNPEPPVFQTILVGSNNQLQAALQGLRRLRFGGVGSVVSNSCLSWQLAGSCRTNCLRAKWHVTLTPQDARKLEEALMPVVSFMGPILCKPVGGSSSASLGYYSGAKRKFETSKINGFQADQQCQASTVLFHADPSVPILDNNLQPPTTSRFSLPTYFGMSFLVGVLSQAGTQLCDKHACSIRIEGGRVKNKGGIPVALLFVTGTNPQDINLCWSDIQHNVLLQAIPASLRRNMLFQLGRLNGALGRSIDMVKTRNPFPSQSEHEEFHWLAIMKAGTFSKPDSNVLAISQVLSMEQLSEDTFPTCLVEVVDPAEMLDAKGQQLFEHLCPHIIVRTFCSDHKCILELN